MAPQRHEGKFRNPVKMHKMGLLKTLGIMLRVIFDKPADTVPARPIPVHALTRAQLLDAADQSVFRLGHSTVLLKLNGEFWLTDPVFSQRASPVQWAGPARFHQPPIGIEDLPPIKGVFLSHSQYDRSTPLIGGRSSMPIGGWWKRAGPAHCTGEARCEKTGSVSQNSPFSFNSTVEWPSRNTLWSAASSNCARVRACTGIGRAGTVSAGLSKMTRSMMPRVFSSPILCIFTGLRNLPSWRCGASGAWSRGRGRRSAGRLALMVILDL